MPFRATFEGNDVYSVLCTDAEWETFRAASKAATGQLRMRCCPTDGIARHSSNGLRHFAHKGMRPADCQWKPVSEEHETLQVAAALTVHAREGWTASMEEIGPTWRADVLATRSRVQVAIEIQISSQAKARTADRNMRFDGSGVVPLWLKGRRNHNNNFGVGFQEKIIGDDLPTQTASVRQLVESFLTKVECQMALARAVSDAVAEMTDWTCEIQYCGGIPCWFALEKEGSKQTILLRELGPEALPKNPRGERNVHAGADEFAGAVIQLGTQRPDLRGYGSYGFTLDRNDLGRSARAVLHPILRGERRWMGRQHQEPVPGSFIHYPERCERCETTFLRITHILVGNPRRPVQMPPVTEEDDFIAIDALTPAAEKLAETLGFPLGQFHGGVTSQTCPHCESQMPPSLISNDEAGSWPHADAHFTLPVPMPGKGWITALRWEERPAHDPAAWNAMMAAKFSARDVERADLRRKKEEDRQKQKEAAAEWRRKLQDQRDKEEADRKAREAAWHVEQEQARLHHEKKKSEGRQSALSKSAERKIKNSERRHLWLHSTNPNTGSLHPIVFAGESDENLAATMRVLETLE